MWIFRVVDEQFIFWVMDWELQYFKSWTDNSSFEILDQQLNYFSDFWSTIFSHIINLISTVKSSYSNSKRDTYSHCYIYLTNCKTLKVLTISQRSNSTTISLPQFDRIFGGRNEMTRIYSTFKLEKSWYKWLILVTPSLKECYPWMKYIWYFNIVFIY